MSAGRCRWRAWSALVAIVIAGVASPCRALMAGASPDTPDARIDGNTPGSPWRGVVAVTVNGSVYSGVLIGRRHVLTAAHVFAINGNPSSAAAQVAFNLGPMPTVLAVDSYTPHPSYGGIGVNDLALVQLAMDAPSAARIYPMAGAVPALGTMLTLVGYGDSGDGSVGVTVGRSQTVKRVGRNTFDVAPNSTVYYFDFDGPIGSFNAMGGTTLGNAVETSVAGGDSGSPAFAGSASSATVIGINAFTGVVNGGPSTPSAFGTVGGGTFVAPYRGWIDATVDASGFGAPANEIPELGRLGWLGLLAVAAAMTRASRLGEKT